MAAEPFHHGNLRAVLLDHAEETLRTRSVDDLSLRELARRAGVSHGAPRSHFIDRQALLDALAERGFARLTTQMSAAAAASRSDLEGRLRGVADAYVRFAVDDAALLELMFSTKNAQAPERVQVAAERLFTAFGSAFEADFRAGRFRLSDPERVKLTFVALIQGTAALITSGRVTPAQGSAVIDDAIALLVDNRPRG